MPEAVGAPVGILGGTFDPVHFGHLRPALEVMESLSLAEVRFLPCGVPPHREPPVASGPDRLAMLRAALAGQPGFRVDERELMRPGPSYMVDTLASLRRELGETTPLCLMVGSDAFAQLTSWYRWEALPDLAHVVVLHRPGAMLPADAALGDCLAQRKLHHTDELGRRPAGGILLQPVTQLDISATAIRQGLAAGRSPRYLMPESVWNHIQARGLYSNEGGG